MVCRNPQLSRASLLQAAAHPIAQQAPPQGRRPSRVRVGKVIGKYKMAKLFELDITEKAFQPRP